MLGHDTSIHSRRARQVAEARASGEAIDIAELPSRSSLIQILGVDYLHTHDEGVGDLYLTAAGLPYARHLHPDNWFEKSWFRSQRVQLEGTGFVCAVPTKPIDGENLTLVVKYSRVGEKVPIETQLIEDVLCCEFNGPFEEFGLVEELRHSRRGDSELQIKTQLPLAIFVPPDRIQPSQSGRFQWRIARKVAKHPGITIDILRQYIVIYQWLPGIDAWQAHKMGFMSEAEVRDLNERAMAEMSLKGFSVLDQKPEHLIVRPEEPGKLARDNGDISYGLVDFELLERNAEYFQELQSARRSTYHHRRHEAEQAANLAAARFAGAEEPELPANLRSVRLFGVDYVHGRAESTGGMLWVVGRDPVLFDFFLPERWRTTPQFRLSDEHETYLTTSKDDVRLVWKVSRVGEPPDTAAFGFDGFRLLASGFNSPFEEVALASWLRSRGMSTVTPCAVYRTGHRSQLDESLFDLSRYRSHEDLCSLDGNPILDPLRNYITIWDFWGTSGGEDGDQTSAVVARSVDAEQAVDLGLLEPSERDALVVGFRERLEAEGVEVLRLSASHILLSIGEDEALRRDDEGSLEASLCNFQYLGLPPGLRNEIREPADQP
jgi:hypothetical protein